MCFKIIIVYSVFGVLFLAKCDLNLPEGASCITDDHNGTCVNLYKCPSAAQTYLYENSGLENYKRLEMPEICSYRDDGEPIVCCTDCNIDNDEDYRQYAVLGRVFHYKNSNPSRAWTECLEFFRTLPYPCRGQFYEGYFVRTPSTTESCFDINYEGGTFGTGGYDAVEGQFPHMALLGYGSDPDSALWLCGGSVISERFILTAAHCSSSPSLGPITYAGLGILRRSELSDLRKVYKIQEVIKHPLYKAPFKYHDIALLRTEYEINFNKFLLPACITHDRTLRWEEDVQAPGWGRLGHRKQLAETLQVLELTRFSVKECSAIFPVHRHLKNGYNDTMQVCYGRQDKVVDTCEGDSGGPIQRNTDDCVYFIIGVTSYGKDCGIPGNAGMYTRVSFYVPWIESVVWPE